MPAVVSVLTFDHLLEIRARHIQNAMCGASLTLLLYRTAAKRSAGQLGRLYADGGRLGLAKSAALKAAETAGNDRDKSVALGELGNAQQAQGDLAGALRSYQAGMGIRQKLAAADPRNSQWQRDPWALLWRLAGFAESGVTWTDVAKALQDTRSRGLLLPPDERF